MHDKDERKVGSAGRRMASKQANRRSDEETARAGQGVDEPAGSVYGYARVSSRDQNLNRQLDALRAFPVQEGNIFCDKASGKDFERPAWHRLERLLGAGDTLVVKSIDRLGRDYGETTDVWRKLIQERHISIVVLDLPLLDTRKSHGDVTGVFLADITLQILSYVAQVERENTRRRQAEGIAAARARGVKFGRPRIERPANYLEVRGMYRAGGITRGEAAGMLGVCPRTFDAWLKEDLSEGCSRSDRASEG